MEDRGKHLVLVDRWFPSSKLCSCCGSKNEKLELSTINWKCQECGAFHNRDQNASKNLLKEGLRQLKSKNVSIISTVGTTGSNACGDDIRLST